MEVVVRMVEILTAFGLLLVLSASALPLRLETGEPVLIDFGPDGTAGYPEI